MTLIWRSVYNPFLTDLETLINQFIVGLLRSPMIVEFCKIYNKKTLAEVYVSLVNRDRIGLILEKYRSIYYLLGSFRLVAAYKW